MILLSSQYQNQSIKAIRTSHKNAQLLEILVFSLQAGRAQEIEITHLLGGRVFAGDLPVVHEISSSLFMELVGKAEKEASFSAAERLSVGEESSPSSAPYLRHLWAPY